MKNLLLGTLILSGAALASAQTITFEKTTIEYGNIKPGSDGHRVFTFKNTGNKPLVISNVKASCGCTVPEWDKNPILPGKTGKIKVGYNTHIKGNFTKTIDVYSNDPKKGRSVLFIKGNVVEK